MVELAPVDAVEVTLVVDNHVAGKGLVVVSGCSHAGAVNVLRKRRPARRARPLTGCKAVHRLARAMPEAFVQPSVGTVL